MCWMETPFKLEMSATWTKKPKRQSMALNFNASPLKSKKEVKHRIRQSDLPTKPPTDRPSFYKLHQRAQVTKSLSSVKLLISGLSLFNLDEKKADL